MRRGLVGLLLVVCVACSPGAPDGTRDRSSASPTGTQTTVQEQDSSPSQQSPESSPTGEEDEREQEPDTQPTPSPSFSLPPGMPEVPGIDEFLDENGQFDPEAFQQWLEKQPGMGTEDGNAGNDNGECNPLSPTCLYDPLWGSCEWDYWRGLYVCDGPFHREGYDCYLDMWWDQYICRRNE